MKKPFKFWRENRIAKEYDLTIDEIKVEFESWLMTIKSANVNAFGVHLAIVTFITHELDSTFEDDRLEELVEALDETYESVAQAKELTTTTD